MTDHPNEPTAVVDAFIAAIERSDVTAAVALLAPDCEYDNVPMGIVHGPEAVAAILRPMLAGCSEVDWPVLRQSSNGPIVCNERLDRFRMAHGWVEVPVAGVWEVHDGLITLWRDYFDETTYRNQLPPRAEGN
ncbi:MAG: limonene-1,2-epoxide hydrolase family protein [Acidimicrobiales bacterium]|jgi:limonene-1,2-epoxide hydrolase|nr:limonene-1,2-epoxide hydrolase family protein [Acidimicrobiales bacterium]